MDAEERRLTVRRLIAAQDALRKAAASRPGLEGPCRAFGRIVRAAIRPMRIGILGESNSGKSTLANFLVGVQTLPALPVANTRLPALLKYAPSPNVAALYESGERVTLSATQNLLQGPIKRLEVGLPSPILQSVEFLDLPGSANALMPASRHDPADHGMDGAIWATVATQAWRESERSHWLQLPKTIRSRSLLVVTFCDLINAEEDVNKLHARLDTSAKPHFREICFMAAGFDDPTLTASMNQFLNAQISVLAQEFSSARLVKAAAIGSRLAENTLGRL
jgi:50S ribosome-binding GTPase